MEQSRRNLLSVCFSQFGNAFSSNFVMVFLPFYILKISSHPPAYTLVWTGLILGSTSFCAAFTSPFWGSLTHRVSPKILFLRSMLVNTVSFFLIGFTTDIHLLFLLRVLQGLTAGTSTIGLIIVSSTSPRDKISSNMGLFQSSLTLGQLLGPLAGSFAAMMLGYQGAFFAASVLLLSAFIFCCLYVTDVPCLPKKEKATGWTIPDRRVFIGGLLCFIATLQITFLPSVLPRVFESFHYDHATALKYVGTVVMCYTATALIGTYVWTRLSGRIGLGRMITFLFIAATGLQAMLTFSRGVVDFTILRMLQTGCVAATFPLVISAFASGSEGGTIGLLNSTRFAGNALGPMVATSILAFTDLPSLYFFLSGITLLALLAFRLLSKPADVRSPQATY